MRDSGIHRLLIALLTIGLTACGSNNGSTTSGSTPSATAQGVAATVSISDAPSDRLISFEVTVKSVTLTKSDGTAVNVLSSPRKVEVTHLAGTSEPLVFSSIPAGTYTGATITVSSPEVAFINNAGQTVEKEDTAFSATLNLTLSPALVVGSDPVVFTFDVNAKNSVSIDVSTGNVTFTPSISVITASVPAAGHESEEDAEHGEIDDVVGQVTQVTSNGFTITLGQSGTSMSFAVNASTRFDDGATLASLTTNSLVRVEGNTQANGTFVATEVKLIDANDKEETEGVVSSTTGNPVTAFSLVLQDGSGGSMNPLMLGTSVQVSLGTNTQFKIDNGNVDLSGLNLPSFSAASLSKAQRIEVDGIQSGSTIAAGTIKLEQQSFGGTVSGFSNSQFTLSVAPDSAFALLTGMSSMNVIVGRSTQVDSGVSLANGVGVRVRGLLLLNASQGSYVFVASRISQP